MYDARATDGVLPSSRATSFTASEIRRRRAAWVPGTSPATVSATAANTVPCHVRKSLAEYPSPASSLTYAFTSSERTSRQPVPLRYARSSALSSRTALERSNDGSELGSLTSWMRRRPLLAR